jgi:hypothetical protein
MMDGSELDECCATSVTKSSARSRFIAFVVSMIGLREKIQQR